MCLEPKNAAKSQELRKMIKPCKIHLLARLCASMHADPIPPHKSQPINMLEAAIGYNYIYIMAPQRGRLNRANLGSMGRNTGTRSIRSDCLSNLTS